MSHGLWTDAELKAVKTDKWLATQLMNEKTLDSKMAAAYPYNQRRTYICDWLNNPHQDYIKIYATDEKMLYKFIDAEYTSRPDIIQQVITQYRRIKQN
jgi:hypothetical protein